jgi:hypothetical protein
LTRSPGLHRARWTNTNDYRCFVLDPRSPSPRILTGYTFIGRSAGAAPPRPGVPHQRGAAWPTPAEASRRRRRPARLGVLQRPEPAPAAAFDRGARGAASPSRDVGLRRPGQPGGRLGARAGPGDLPARLRDPHGAGRRPRAPAALPLRGRRPPPTVPASPSSSIPSTSSDVQGAAGGQPARPGRDPVRPRGSADAAAVRPRGRAGRTTSRSSTGPSGAGNEAGLLMLCGQTPEALTEDFDGNVARSSCDLSRCPRTDHRHGVLGHMHTLGKSTFRLTLDAGHDRSEQILLDIPEWSFDWQMNYALAEPLRVKAGQPLRLECSWDRPAPTRCGPQVHRVRRGHRGRDVLRHLRAHPRPPGSLTVTPTGHGA